MGWRHGARSGPRPSASLPAIDAALRRHPPGTPQHGGLLLERAQARIRLGDHEGALADCRLALATEGLTASAAAVATIDAARSILRLRLVEEYEAVEQQLAELPPIVVGHNVELWTDVRQLLLLGAGAPTEPVRRLLATAPRFARSDPPPTPDVRHQRATLRYHAGDVAAALAEVEAAVGEHLDVRLRAELYNLGALCIAVLDDRHRLAQAAFWADEAIIMAEAGEPTLAVRHTRAAVASVAGAGDAALPDLEEGLAYVEAHLVGRERIWARAFLARACLDAGHVDEARHHLEAVEASGVTAPVATRVRADLDALDAGRRS